MKELWSKRCRGLTPYIPGEQVEGEKVIRLNTNENPYPPSPMALKAIREAMENVRLYPDPECVELRKAIAQSLGVRAEQVFVGNGSDEVLALAFHAFFDPEEPIRFADVTYTFYPIYADFHGLSYERIPVDENFAVPVEPFLQPGGGIVLANPNAPTGREMDFCDLRAIIEANPNRVVIVDEAYIDFAARSAVELVDTHPNLLVIRTFSKSRALAGLRVGYAIGDAGLIAALSTSKNSFNSYPVDRLAQAGALGAIRDTDYFQTTIAKILNTRAKAIRDVRALGFTVFDSSTNFLFVTHERIPGKELQAGLRERGILVRRWDEPRIYDYLRITVGTPEDMEALCLALKEILAEKL